MDNEFIVVKPMMNQKNDFRVSNNKLYSEIENLIISWNVDGTKTAGFLTRQIIELLNKKVIWIFNTDYIK